MTEPECNIPISCKYSITRTGSASSIATNGAYITQELIDRLPREECVGSVSIDGTAFHKELRIQRSARTPAARRARTASMSTRLSISTRMAACRQQCLWRPLRMVRMITIQPTRFQPMAGR